MLKLKLQYWPHDVKSLLIRKDPDVGKDRGQKERGPSGHEAEKTQEQWRTGKPAIVQFTGSQSGMTEPLNSSNPPESLLHTAFSSVSSVQSLSGVRLFATPWTAQHARPPCPSPTPRVYSNSCPSSRWCHPTISSSVVPFSSCPQSSQHQGLF